jgi:exodeoxyribonuclease VII large subunit
VRKTAETQPTGEIYSVSQLNREARQLLEDALPQLWVSGEISNLAKPGSGHLYFSLKDADAQVRCAMFRSAANRLRFRPKDGDQVLVQGRVSIYEARGSYQLIIAQMEEAGEGLLRKKFEALKAQLSAEGLFDPSRKQALPELPASIGIVTSPTGAAIRDILHVLKRRYPSARVLIYPTRVQGEGSAEEIAGAIHTASARAECDVLIVTRGGGSLEDLWSFNEEIVARAVYDCAIPVVSAVGHEIDFTIADLVADVRAPTPSGAAEIVTPDTSDMLRSLDTIKRRLFQAIRHRAAVLRAQSTRMTVRLERTHPGTKLRQLQQRADDLNRQLLVGMTNLTGQRRVQQQALNHRLREAAPDSLLNSYSGKSATLAIRLDNSIRNIIRDMRGRLAVSAGALNSISPLATLERGYAIVADAETGAILRDVQNIKAGDRIQARLAQGRLEAIVKKTFDN